MGTARVRSSRGGPWARGAFRARPLHVHTAVAWCRVCLRRPAHSAHVLCSAAFVGPPSLPSLVRDRKVLKGAWWGLGVRGRAGSRQRWSASRWVGGSVGRWIGGSVDRWGGGAVGRMAGRAVVEGSHRGQTSSVAKFTHSCHGHHELVGHDLDLLKRAVDHPVEQHVEACAIRRRDLDEPWEGLGDGWGVRMRGCEWSGEARASVLEQGLGPGLVGQGPRAKTEADFMRYGDSAPLRPTHLAGRGSSPPPQTPWAE